MDKAILPYIGKWGFLSTCFCIFVFVPTSLFESGHSICIIKNVFGVGCPGCGMTRAISSIFHGNVAAAFQYNKLIAFVFPLLGYICIKAIIQDYRQVLVLKNRLTRRST
jgi:hypothetical protein